MGRSETRNAIRSGIIWAVVLVILCIGAPLTAGAGTVTYTYDQAGRLTGVNYANGKIIHYAYDAMGNILRLVEGSMPGDVNADSVIGLEDAIVAAKLACSMDAGLTFIGGDVNADDRIDLTEAIYVLQCISER